MDETADEKSSADAVGAARQYSGTVGGLALCQVAVTLTYATGRGHALIGRALYLPEGCAADEEHRELADVPEDEKKPPYVRTIERPQRMLSRSPVTAEPGADLPMPLPSCRSPASR